MTESNSTERASDTRSSLLSAYDKQTEEALQAMDQNIVMEAESMLADTNLVDLILNDIEAVGVVGEAELALTIYILGTSRLLDRPLSAIVQGKSSTGKDFVKGHVARMFPDEAVVRATDLTPQSLYYMVPGSLMHRFVVTGERKRLKQDDQANATKALREMISDGELWKLVTLKLKGQQSTVRIHQFGPIAYVETTTLSTMNIFDEDLNRCLLLSTDDSSEQTRLIVEAVARNAQIGASDRSDARAICVRHCAMQRMLKRVKVLIPFAEKLAAAMPVDQPKARRAIRQVLDFIRAIALLHQRQRSDGSISDGDTIDATLDDYVVARRLLSDPLARSFGLSLTGGAKKLLKRLKARYPESSFTAKQVEIDDPIVNSRGKINEYLRELRTCGFVEMTEKGIGNQLSVWRVVADVPSDGSLWLPTVDELQEVKHDAVPALV